MRRPGLAARALALAALALASTTAPYGANAQAELAEAAALAAAASRAASAQAAAGTIPKKQAVEDFDGYAELRLNAADLDQEDEDGEERSYGEEDNADLDDKFHMDDFSPSHVFTFPMDSRYEECFYEDVSKTPQRLRGAYFVTSESGMDVTVTVSYVRGAGPKDSEQLFRDSGKNEGTFNVVARRTGQYKFCFSTSKLGKRVTFALHVGVRRREHATGKHITPMEESIRTCHRTLQQLVSEQTYLITRVHQHMVTQDSTEWRIGYYTVFESVFMISVTVGQIFFVQRLINNRQWV